MTDDPTPSPLISQDEWEKTASDEPYPTSEEKRAALPNRWAAFTTNELTELEDALHSQREEHADDLTGRPELTVHVELKAELERRKP